MAKINKRKKEKKRAVCQFLRQVLGKKVCFTSLKGMNKHPVLCWNQRKYGGGFTDSRVKESRTLYDFCTPMINQVNRCPTNYQWGDQYNSWRMEPYYYVSWNNRYPTFLPPLPKVI